MVDDLRAPYGPLRLDCKKALFTTWTRANGVECPRIPSAWPLRVDESIVISSPGKSMSLWSSEVPKLYDYAMMHISGVVGTTCSERPPTAVDGRRGLWWYIV